MAVSVEREVQPFGVLAARRHDERIDPDHQAVGVQ
jgi:hypothetical protein